MAYFYEFELILAGIVLLSTMTYAGIRIWFKRKRETSEDKLSERLEQTENTDGDFSS